MLIIAVVLFINNATAAPTLDCKSSIKNPHYEIKTTTLSGGYEKITIAGPDAFSHEYIIDGARKIPVGDEMAIFGTMISNSVESTDINLNLLTDNQFEMYSVTLKGQPKNPMNTAFFFDHQTPGLQKLNLETGVRSGNKIPQQGSLYFNCINFVVYLEYIEQHYQQHVSSDRPIRELAAKFTSAYIDKNLMFDNHYLGVEIWQNPFDMWVFQQMITELKPDVIVETGTAHAGSTLFFATILEKINPDARIITIDINPEIDKNISKARSYPVFNRMVSLIKGDSVSANTIIQIHALIDKAKQDKSETNELAGSQELVVLVTLDSLHSAKHVLKELQLYSQFVSPGSYIVVQDTIIDQKKKYFDWFVAPWAEDSEAGPAQATRTFLKQNQDFQSDNQWEKYYFTFYPGGFLKRIR